MSHVRTEIEPAEGLTVLVGPNNCGKSAVVSALQTVCGEHAGDFMVRHGERVARVTIETADGHTIVWQRKGPTPSYVIDGREVHRVGRGNLPDDLHELLKLPPVTSNDGAKKFAVHFGLQKTPIFLLDSQTDAATFFSSSAEAERLLEMQRRHKQKVQSAKTEHKAVEADLERLGAQLAGLEPLDAITLEVEKLEASRVALEAGQAAITALERLIERTVAVRQERGMLAARCAAGEGLQAPPKMEETAPVERLIGGIGRWSAEASRARREAAALDGLRAPEAEAPTPPLVALIERISATRRTGAGAQTRAAALDALHEPPELADPAPLTALGKQLAAAMKSLGAARARVNALAALHEPPQPADDAPLRQALDGMAKVLAEMARHRRRADEMDRALAANAADIRAWAAGNPTCPMCGAEVDGERLLTGGHVHA